MEPYEFGTKLYHFIRKYASKNNLSILSWEKAGILAHLEVVNKI